MTEALLQISNLSAAYGQVFALRDFSCAIEEGKITALVGSNGAGKTTTFKMLTGDVNPTNG